MSTPVLRRLLASAAITSVAASIPSFVALARFSDVSTSTQYRTAIEALQEDGILQGYADGSFKANAKINRAEFLKIVLESRGDVQENAGGCFPDVQDAWFTKYVCTAMQEGIVSGYPDGLFRPEREISFVEAAKILSLAYNQKIEQSSGEWYEGYARAIESSKGIPPSVDRLDKQITRGEMAEMMWRLRENRTDQPTKGYLNVKYPELKVNLAADMPQRATSCADIRALSEEASTSGMGDGGDVMMRDMSESDGAAAPAATKSTQNSYSQTNVQVAGVDESDIVKTDGEYLYMIRGSEVRIVRVGRPTDLELSAVLSFEKDGFTPSELYIDGERLIVLGQKWNAGPGPIQPMMEKRMMSPLIYPYYQPKAEVRIYDISDRRNPKIERTVSFEGSTLTSRRIEDKLYIVINQPISWARPMPLMEIPEADLLPKMEDSKRGVAAIARCTDVMILPHVPTREYLTIGVIPLRNPTAEVKSEVILGSAQNVYSSLNNLYVATTENRYLWNIQDDAGATEKTNIYRFAFTSDGADLQAQGSVPGHVLNQFSMDEHENHFRVATTTNEQWIPNGSSIPSKNALYVLSHDLKHVGSIEDMAPGERIYSARFLGDRAYMVTFRQIDPLFVIDVSSPSNPRILGSLKIPGYSDYLHPYDENHIIGFGKEAVAAKDSNFAWYQGMKIAIFDVRDVENPRELHKTVIGDRGTESPLLHNHKALLFDKERNLLTFPVSVAEIPAEQRSLPEGQAYGSPVFQGAYVYDITLKDGFRLRGKLTHYPEGTFEKAGDYYYGYGKDVERLIRVDTSLFTIGQDSVRSYELGTLDAQDAVTFPVEAPQPIPLY